MNKFFKIGNQRFIKVKCPDCELMHNVSHKNYYAQKNGKRNLSFRCTKCGHARAMKTRRNPNLRKVNSNGYIKIYVPENPMSDKRGEVYEHRLVMSKILNRPLQSWEHVHHKDGNRANNSPDNLELHPNSEHQTIRFMKERIYYLENLLTKHNIPF